MLSFKDFIVVDYTQTGDEQLAYNAYKRKRGRIGEETETTDEALSIAQRRQKAMTMKRFKSKIAIGRKRATPTSTDTRRSQEESNEASTEPSVPKVLEGCFPFGSHTNCS